MVSRKRWGADEGTKGRGDEGAGLDSANRHRITVFGKRPLRADIEHPTAAAQQPRALTENCPPRLSDCHSHST